MASQQAILGGISAGGNLLHFTIISVLLQTSGFPGRCRIILPLHPQWPVLSTVLLECSGVRSLPLPQRDLLRRAPCGALPTNGRLPLVREMLSSMEHWVQPLLRCQGQRVKSLTNICRGKENSGDICFGPVHQNVPGKNIKRRISLGEIIRQILHY